MGPVLSLFKDSAFEPEELLAMGDAYVRVVKAMPEANTKVVAVIIIEMAQRGVRDAPTLASSAFDWLVEQSRMQA